MSRALEGQDKLGPTFGVAWRILQARTAPIDTGSGGRWESWAPPKTKPKKNSWMQTRSRERKRERSCGWARMRDKENLDRRVHTIQKPSLIVKPKVTLQFCGLSVKWKHKAYTANWRNTNCDKQTDPHYICSSPLRKVSSCCVIISYEAVCPVCSYQVLFISICKHKEKQST